MAIVINDFEVVVETPQPDAPAATAAALAQTAGSAAGAAALTPDDLRRIDEHLAARAERLRAD